MPPTSAVSASRATTLFLSIGFSSAIRDAAAPRLTYAGIGLYRPELFARCQPGRFPLLPLLRAAIAERRLTGERYDGTWVDVGSAQRLAALNAAPA